MGSRPPRRAVFRACLLQAVASAVGFTWGRLPAPRGWRFDWGAGFPVAGGLVFLLLLIGIARSTIRREKLGPEVPWICWGVFAYVALLVLTEPFLRGSDDGLLTAYGMVVLVPALLATGYFARIGVWSAAAAAALFFATGIAMLIRNGESLGKGIGFHSGWVR